jgi:SAM-dependent methyltransferase
MSRRPYLDFYGKHGISPVANEVNLSTHFVQRKALYYQLGILNGSIRDRHVLEFGPGNGVNALYTISQEPKQYVLVDANPTGIENCKNNLNRFYPERNWQIIDSMIEKYNSDEKVDLVICEGLLPNQVNPEKMAKHCASFVKDGGLFVFTCHDMISTVSETLRCLPGVLLIRNVNSFDEKVTKLANFYAPHLAYLDGMTRTKEEWVVDNILNAEFWQDAPLFSIYEAIESLKENFTVHATSPTFLQDWTWYKSVKNVKNHFNESMKESYWANVHNFIDWRIVSPPRYESDNRDLYELCRDIRTRVREAAEDKSRISALIESCQKLSVCLPEEYFSTKTAIESYIGGIKFYKENGEINFKLFEKFGAWWGRGLQYVSFIKN